MAIMTEQQARELLARVLELSEADECECNLAGSNDGNIRYARNTVSTAGEVSDVTLSPFSRASASKPAFQRSTNLTMRSLERVVQRSEQLARLAPENPEWMPLLGPQEYKETPTWSEATANVTPEQRARSGRGEYRPSKEEELVAAGFLDDERSLHRNNEQQGLFALQHPVRSATSQLRYAPPMALAQAGCRATTTTSRNSTLAPPRKWPSKSHSVRAMPGPWNPGATR